jgi:hypothetical protein
MTRKRGSASVELQLDPALEAAAERAAAKGKQTVPSLIEKVLADHLRKGGFLTEGEKAAARSRKSRHYETGD